MKSAKIFLLIAVAACLGSCSGPALLRIVDTPVHSGMTEDQLLSAFGAPLRVETKPGGGADWIYDFANTTNDSGRVSGYDDDDDCGNGGFYTGEFESVELSYSEGTIHLSKAGRVVGEIPSGRVVRK